VNGAVKLRDLSPEQDYLSTFDIILLQETFTMDDVLPYELEGYIAYHAPARFTTRRPQWGMTSLFKISSFVGGRLQLIPVPFEWLLANRWIRASGLGVTIVNVYIPAHWRGTSAQDISHFATFLRDLVISFPGDVIICGGDINCNRWRLDGQLASSRPPSLLIR
jgi:exonuclease III